MAEAMTEEPERVTELRTLATTDSYLDIAHCLELFAELNRSYDEIDRLRALNIALSEDLGRQGEH